MVVELMNSLLMIQTNNFGGMKAHKKLVITQMAWTSQRDISLLIKRINLLVLHNLIHLVSFIK